MQEMKQSKSSFFNKRIFINDLKKELVLTVGVCLCFILIVMVPVFLGRNNIGYVDAILWLSNPVPIAMLAIIFALLSFSYLYKNTASHMLHAMPVKRETHFVSHYLAGLCTLMLTVIVCAGLIIIKNDFTGSHPLSGIIIALIEVVFFYSLAVFTVMACGNTALAIATYIVLNLLWLFFNVILSIVNYFIMWDPIVSTASDVLGMSINPNYDALFPVVFFVRHMDESNGALTSLIMLIPAVAFIIISLIMYKKRKIENTGELVAFSWCKVVCRVLFTVCFAGLLTVAILFGIQTPPEGPVLYFSLLLTIIVGGFIGFIISEMLMQKTVRIFSGRKIPFIQGLIPICLIGLYVCLLGAGVIGGDRIPSATDTQRVVVYPGIGNGALVYADDDTKAEALEICKILHEDEELRENNLKHRDGGFMSDDKYVSIFIEGSAGSTFMSIYSNDDKKVINPFVTLAGKGGHTAENVFGPNPKTRDVRDVTFKNLYDADGMAWCTPTLIKTDYNGDDLVIDVSDASTPTGMVIYESDDDPEHDTYKASALSYPDFYEALLKDMAEGNVIPCGSEEAKELGYEYDGKILCDVRISLKGMTDIPMFNDMEADVALTTKSMHTIDLLRQCGALK